MLIFEPQVFGDRRGGFFESFNQRAFDAAIGRHVEFVQDNQSRSEKHVLRGLHFQRHPHEQGKLVRVVSGAVFDVAADPRPDSPTFGQWVGIELSSENHKQLWIPPGYAHGFLVLSEKADFFYKVTEYYSPSHEASMRWNDPTLAIDWPLAGASPILSQKDAEAPLLKTREADGTS